MQKLDFDQLKTIIKYSLIMELRGKVSRNAKKRSYRVLIALAVVYVFSGFYLGVISSQIADPFTTAFISATFFMILSGSFILLEYPTLVTGPEDFSFYATRPVSPGTYFTGKVLSTLSLVSILFLTFSLPYTVISLVNNKPVIQVAGNIFSIYLTGITTALIIINLYALLVKFIPYRVIRSVASFLQFITFFAVYGINLFATRYIRQGNLDFTFNLEPWFLLVPSAWIPAGYRLSAGPLGLAALGLGILSIPLLLFISTRVVSMDYAARISEFAVKSETKKTKGKSQSVIWQSPEGFAISRVIINHLKYNTQFRTGIIAILPVTIIYFLVAIIINEAPILDPFTQAGKAGFMGTLILYIAIGFFPVYIKNALSYSTEAEASWIFFVTPASRIKLIKACRQFILLFFLVPYLVIFTIVFAVLTGALLHTIMHFLVITLLALILLNLFLFFFAELPFSKIPQKGHRTAQMYLRILLAFILPVPLTLFVLFLYPTPVTYWLGVAGLAILFWLSEHFGKQMAENKLNREEYQG